MAIVLRMVSADGKKVIMKSLPGLPTRIKVPAGAKVDVTENGQTKTLAQYVNEHSNRSEHEAVLHDSGVTVETVDSWETAEAWADSLAGSPDNQQWFSDASEGGESKVLGLGTTALLVGGVVAAGAVYGVTELTKDDKDTTPPLAPSGLDLAAEDDAGRSDSDNITNKTADLTISGTAEAGASVELFNGTVSLGTVTAGADGKFTKDVTLTAGASHAITARATDSAGNASSLSTVLQIGVDGTAPAAPSALDLADADDSGAPKDDITNKITDLTITGTAEANSTVELFSGTTSLGTVVAAANGTFSKDVTLAAGVNEITARATDTAGNLGAASPVLKVTVDTTGPAAPTNLDLAAVDDTGPSNSDNVTGKTTALTVSGVAEPNATIEYFDGTTSLGTVVAAANGVFTKDLTLGNGPHDITTRATDVAGNVGAASEVLRITVDGTPPAAPTGLDLLAEDDKGFSDSDNITNQTSGLTIVGSAEAGSSVQLLAGTATLGVVTAGADGTFRLDNISLAVGTYDITAKATDADGNVGPVSGAFTIRVDTTAPNAPTGLDLAAADDNGASNSDNITSQTSGLTITGNAEAGSRIELFDGTTSLGTVLVDANGLFTTDVALGLGEHDITAKATDAAGNVGAASSVLDITIVASATLLSADIDHLSLASSSHTFG